VAHGARHQEACISILPVRHSETTLNVSRVLQPPDTLLIHRTN